MISTANLSRSFRAPDGDEVRAVRGIDFSVAPGETVAVLGPNGAGKSTLMRMLSTLLPPTGGTARVAGFDVRTQGPLVREHIGYVGQGNGAGHTQRAVDEVVTQGRIHGLGRTAARARAAELLSVLGLERLARRRTQAMSGGQRRLVLLGVLGVGIGSLSCALAIAVREQDWMFWTVHQTVLFPLMILSGMLLPLDEGPRWMRVLAQFNPLTHVVDAERALFAGRIATPDVAYGFLAAAVTAVLGFVLGLRALRASTD
ncbi:ABC-2 family transporter [Murinocardiopsis flavida]|uniref:ABC-2 family transporter n=1 Tax=Murinocardiopsis flavida TaxID=645275 RepID=A0A2P8CBC5_9ACTN|nr:ATP-binding cassette domain-containing protein [Murinocardiopsis flavida]PSK82245.1 ABC-2 family transporter [Murinocardiopsis flavida]